MLVQFYSTFIYLQIYDYIVLWSLIHARGYIWEFTLPHGSMFRDQGCTPRPAPLGRVKVCPAPPTPWKGGFAPPRPVKITKTCGAQWGKVDFNPLKFGRQFQGKIKFCPINNCLTLTNTFLPRHAPRIFPLPRSAPRPKSSAPCIPEWHIATSCKSFRGWICHHPLSHTSKEFHHP